MKMKIRNLTPHEVNIIDEQGITTKSFPSEGVARASQVATPVGEVDGIELVHMEYGKPVDLPEPEEGVMLIVSLITVQAAKASGRRTDDLLLTAGQVRNGKGVIIGCRRLALA
jgi:hypothetical protein